MLFFLNKQNGDDRIVTNEKLSQRIEYKVKVKPRAQFIIMKSKSDLNCR